jgi:hypothetical protein
VIEPALDEQSHRRFGDTLAGLFLLQLAQAH